MFFNLNPTSDQNGLRPVPFCRPLALHIQGGQTVGSVTERSIAAAKLCQPARRPSASGQNATRFFCERSESKKIASRLAPETEGLLASYITIMQESCQAKFVITRSNLPAVSLRITTCSLLRRGYTTYKGIYPKLENTWMERVVKLG